MISSKDRIAFVSRILYIKPRIRILLFLLCFGICITLFFNLPLSSQQTDPGTLAVATNPSDIVKAGEKVSFTITLDRAPNFKGGALLYWIIAPNKTTIQSAIDLELGRRVYKLDFYVPVAASGGTWTLSELKFSPGFGELIPLKFKPVSFQVIPNTSLIFPAAAEAKVNPSQVQLLRQEAVRVQTRIQTLKANLTKIQPQLKREQLITLLRRYLNEALDAVERTERSFNDLKGSEPELLAAKVFFEDLQTSYRQALEQLANAQAQAQNEPLFQVVTLATETQIKRDPIAYPLLAQVALRVLEQNELAYNVVANKESLTFDLEVNSIPAGATVYFWRRGDPERKNDKPTNSTIPSLPYAIWLVRFQAPGYRDEEREHDPFREPNHVMTVELQK